MTLVQILINLLFAFLAFFATRYVATLVMPSSQDRQNIINVVAVLVAILVFFANLAVRVHA